MRGHAFGLVRPTGPHRKKPVFLCASCRFQAQGARALGCASAGGVLQHWLDREASVGRYHARARLWFSLPCTDLAYRSAEGNQISGKKKGPVNRPTL